MTDTLIEVRDLRIHFFTDEGVVRAVDGTDLDIRRGKTLALVGESGCGKSVACRALLKIVHSPGKIVSGEILLHRNGSAEQAEAVDIAQLPPRGRRIRTIRGKEIAMIFQEPMSSLSPMYTGSVEGGSVGTAVGTAVGGTFVGARVGVGVAAGAQPAKTARTSNKSVTLRNISSFLLSYRASGLPLSPNS